MHRVTLLCSRNTVKLHRACGRRQALYRGNHLAQQQRGLLVLVGQLLRLQREPAAVSRCIVMAKGKTRGDGRAEFSAGNNRDAPFFFPLRVSLKSVCICCLASRRPLIRMMLQQVRRTAATVNWITLWDSSWRRKCHWSST